MNMQAIEFKTTIHNGTVTIPAEYSPEWEGKTIRVIVLYDEENLAQTVEQPKASNFRAVSLKTKGFKFNREEANVR
jgi:hypothetical protein